MESTNRQAKNLKISVLVCVALITAAMLSGAIVFAACSFCPRYQWVIAGGILDTRTGTLYRTGSSRGPWKAHAYFERKAPAKPKNSGFWEDDAVPSVH
jgi:hypothetical protein